MKRFAGVFVCCILMAAVAVIAMPARALEASLPAAQAPDAAPAVTQPAPASLAMDPALRALVIGLAASVLRDAAASPDPVGALGQTFERTLTGMLQSPETVRLAQGLVGMAVKDAPVELREPLALFAMSVVNHLRREMLNDSRPRTPF